MGGIGGLWLERAILFSVETGKTVLGKLFFFLCLSFLIRKAQVSSLHVPCTSVVGWMDGQIDWEGEGIILLLSISNVHGQNNLLLVMHFARLKKRKNFLINLISGIYILKSTCCCLRKKLVTHSFIHLINNFEHVPGAVLGTGNA